MSEQLKSFSLDLTNTIEHQTAIDLLSTSCPQISINKLKFAMSYGAVWLTHDKNKTVRIRRAKKRLSVGDKLFIYYDEKILFTQVKPAQLISDEGEYSVWNKPAGMFSQGTKWGDHSSIARWVELFGLAKNNLTPRPAFLVHRLDRATSGIILVAHSKKMVVSFTALFEHRQIEKQYEAVVAGEFPSELVTRPIQDEIDGKAATTIVLSSQYDQAINQSTLVVNIETGRKHQIRRHLSLKGFPIIGDRLYRGAHLTRPDENDALNPRENKEQTDLKLKSIYLGFLCPLSQIRREFLN